MASVSFAQESGAGAPVGIAVGLQRAYAALKANLTQSGEKMSEADYSFRPTNEVRNDGQLWGHVANAPSTENQGRRGGGGGRGRGRE